MSQSLPPMVPGPEGYSVLPPGKHQCTFAEFYDRFVSSHAGDVELRQRIMNDFLWIYHRQAEVGLAVTSYWFDGSFVSGKPSPGDIDFVTLVDGPASAVTEDPIPWISSSDAFQQIPAPGAGRRLLVDIYSLVNLGENASSAALDEYETMKAYWNDWWQRTRPTAEKQAKGYVEVINDGSFEIRA